LSDAGAFAPDLLNCVHADSLEELRRRLDDGGFSVHELDGREVTDEVTFLAAAGRSWPVEEGLTTRSADAFLDAVAGGVVASGADRVAFIWTHAEVLEREDLQTFVDLATLLLDTSRRVYALGGRDGREVGLHSFLVGDGPNFRRL
jgi:hypothetical protein